MNLWLDWSLTITELKPYDFYYYSDWTKHEPIARLKHDLFGKTRRCLNDQSSYGAIGFLRHCTQTHKTHTYKHTHLLGPYHLVLSLGDSQPQKIFSYDFSVLNFQLVQKLLIYILRLSADDEFFSGASQTQVYLVVWRPLVHLQMMRCFVL